MKKNVDNKNDNNSNDKYDHLKNKFEEQTQKLDQLQNSQSIFLKNLSQNIRIPLNGIVGMIDVMKMTNVTREQAEYLDIINNYGDSLIRIVNDILDYSHIISGTLELDQKYFFPERLQSDIDHSYRLRIEGKGLDFHLKIDPDIPPQLFGDIFRIKQIISNLIDNSIRYTKEGEISLQIALLDEIEDAQAVKKSVKIRFLVSDSGYGLSQDKQNMLRKELAKSQKESVISTEIIGLGLSISQALLRLFNSSIYFSSSPDKGSEFWFDLEFKFKKNKIPSQYISTQHSDKKLSILLVEDNILNQKFAVATLVKNGHNVVVAENGKIAYEKFLATSFDLILMDIQMPILDGVQATKNIRAFESRNNVEKPIKIVAVTAYALDRDRDKCLEAGMDKFLAKPFKPDQLLNIIDNLDFGL